MRPSAINLLFVVELFLYIITYILIKPVDAIVLKDLASGFLYYALSLPATTWILIPLSVFVAMYSPRRIHRMLSVFILVSLIELLPALVLVNPWLPDQYPYLSEAYWIYLHGKIRDVHYLSEVPGLGLLYGILQLLINVDPFTVSKIYALIQSIMLSIFLTIISARVLRAEYLLPLLFIAFNYFFQIDIFHRATLHFTYALVFIYLIIETLKGASAEDWKRKFTILAVQFSAMTLTYPGSGYILALLITMAFLSILLKYNVKREVLAILLSITAIFTSWYLYVSWSEVRIAGSIINSLLEVLRLDMPFVESATHPFATGLTKTFRTLVYLRLAIEGSLMMSGFIVASTNIIRCFIHREKNIELTTQIIYALTVSAYIAIAPWLLTEWSRWSFYKFDGYLLLFSLMSLTTFFKRASPIIKPGLLKRIICVALILALALVPILRYASVPYLHVTTQELDSVMFIHRYYSFTSDAYYLEYAPYTLPRLLTSRDLAHDVVSFYWFDDPKNDGIYVFTLRALTREAFYVYPTQLVYRLESLDTFMNTYSLRVYDNAFNWAYYFVK